MTSPAPILDLIDAFRRSKTMFVACALSVFDKLAAGPAEAAALAEDGDVPAMERLLDACVSLGLLARDGARYANTSVADTYLRRESEHSLAGYVLYANQVQYPLWGNLEDAVREGTHRWKQTFGLDGMLFSHFYQSEERKREFLRAMHGMGRASSIAIAGHFDLSPFHRIVDLGGATGHLALAAANRFPHLTAAVFDLPEVIEFARAFEPDPRLEWIAGDFFRDPLPPADLYGLGRILHDWTEPKIRLLLATISAALPPGGGLLIAERLLDDDLQGPVSVHMQSLNMLLCTEGRERSLPQYTALLTEAGFATVEGFRTGTPVDGILARKSA